MKRVEFVYEHDEVVFGQYDIMYPQTTDTRTVLSSFDGDVKLKEYFNHYVSWLVEVGFSKEEIHKQMMNYCEFKDEISTSVR
nr:hypothetical protein [uncultured Mediterranean phage uvMED]|tara:strand:- start:1027 stop:1272 length:246 start_codon:yes stop_codon:yes gene_type:complete